MPARENPRQEETITTAYLMRPAPAPETAAASSNGAPASSTAVRQATVTTPKTSSAIG
jgi:hypothetical protein